jgi:chemotaxis protein MotB
MLSTARAISVYNYLIDKKNLIPANMKTSGFGDTRPKASNKTAKGRALNRRVVIKIYNNLNSNQ